MSSAASFESEIKQLLTDLRQALVADRLAHAYLLCGRSGRILRCAIDKILALLYCESAVAQRPCGECSACRQAAGHHHPNVLWLEPESKSRRILTAQIDEMRGHVMQTAFRGGWQTVVLMDAERMTAESANHVLKILEEPPSASLFWLVTTNPEELPATVVSRCQKLVLRSADPAAGQAARELVLAAMTQFPGAGLAPALARAHFILGRLKEWRDAVTDEENRALADLLEQADDKAARQALEKIAEARIEAQCRSRIELVIEGLLFWYRDLLLAACGADRALLVYGANAEQIVAAAQCLTRRQIFVALAIVEEMQAQLDRHLRETVIFEGGFMRLAAAEAQIA